MEGLDTIERFYIYRVLWVFALQHMYASALFEYDVFNKYIVLVEMFRMSPGVLKIFSLVLFFRMLFLCACLRHCELVKARVYVFFFLLSINFTDME